MRLGRSFVFYPSLTLTFTSIHPAWIRSPRFYCPTSADSFSLALPSLLPSFGRLQNATVTSKHGLITAVSLRSDSSCSGQARSSLEAVGEALVGRVFGERDVSRSEEACSRRGNLSDLKREVLDWVVEEM
jgi:hypothetical protein